MPKTDLPLAELLEYQGATPRPHDFDDYWARAIAEVAALPLDYRIEKADFGTGKVECFHLYFTGVGGAELHAQVSRPAPAEGPCPVMLCFHGYRGKAHDWYRELAFPLSGIAVVGLDVRGQAGSSMDNQVYEGNTVIGQLDRGLRSNDPDKMFYRSVYQDTLLLARLVRSFDWVDPDAVSAVGFSQGGGLALACSALNAMAGQPLANTVAGYPFLTDFQGLYEANFPSIAHDEFVAHFRNQDPLHRTEQRFFELLGYLDGQWLAEKIPTPTRVIATLCDEVVPPRAHFAAYNHLRCEQKDLIIYHDYGHEELPESWLGIYRVLLGLEQIGTQPPKVDYREAPALLP